MCNNILFIFLVHFSGSGENIRSLCWSRSGRHRKHISLAVSDIGVLRKPDVQFTVLEHTIVITPFLLLPVVIHIPFSE